MVDPNTEAATYTRHGRLNINASGHIVVGSTGTGLPFVPSIQIPDDAMSIVITPKGEVLTRVPGQTELRQVGQLQISKFVSPDGLLEIGEKMFSETEASGAAQMTMPGQDGAGFIHQGCLEWTDNDQIRELIDLLTQLINVQHAEESLSTRRKEMVDERRRIMEELRVSNRDGAAYRHHVAAANLEEAKRFGDSAEQVKRLEETLSFHKRAVDMWQGKMPPIDRELTELDHRLAAIEDWRRP
jgi:hypothetical protein